MGKRPISTQKWFFSELSTCLKMILTYTYMSTHEIIYSAFPHFLWLNISEFKSAISFNDRMFISWFDFPSHDIYI